MGRLRVLSGAEVIRIMEDHDFTQVRQVGDHVSMQRKVSDTTITVPVPLHRELAIGTLQSIIRMSRLPKGLFEVP